MQRKDRPLSREKKVSGGTAHVGRREGAGSVGGSAQRPQEGAPARSTSGAQQRSSGRRSPLMTIIVLAAVLLLGGGGGLTALLGGQGGTGQGGTLDGPAVQSGAPSLTQGGAPEQQAGELDTSVSTKARDKYTVLKGGGRDVTTIMVYMCGTDLESNGGFATKDLQEMIAADLGKNVNLLVYTGGCKQWKNNQVSSSKNQIFQIRDGGLALLYETPSLQPMTDPGTLSGYIRWAREKFPADRYELIFWDHGGGSVSGYGYDEVYPRSGSMTLDGIAQALRDGGCTFDFIGFDACLMATLETALVAEPYADYLIASEETEPGCGWYYTDWLTALGASPSMGALEIGKNIADSFVSVCAQVAARQQATLSVIDLAELHGTVPGAFKSFAQAASASIKADRYQDIATARSQTKEFARSSNIDQIDLIHLADNMDTRESRALSKALRSAVKYNATSSNIRNANGVSIYFPYGRASSVSKASRIYDEIGLDKSYTDCIKSFASLEVAGQSVSGGSAAQLESLFGSLMGGGSSASPGADMISQLLEGLLTGSSRSLGNVGLEAEQADFLDAELISSSGDYLAGHRFDPSALKWTEKGGQQVLALPEEQWDLIQDVELNVFVDDGTGYIDLGLDNVFEFNGDGDLIGDYDRTWLAVNGQIVAYYMLDSEGTAEDYKITGYIPALLNDRRVDLMVAFTDEVPDGEILGAALRYNEDEQTATVARGLLEIQDGDTIDFICDFYGYDRSFQDAYYLGERLTVDGALTLSNVTMDNADYLACFRLTDIYNNRYWTPCVP